MEKLQWYEPPAYRRAVAHQRRGQRPWEGLRVAVTAFLAIIAVHGISGFLRPDPNRIGWPAVLALASVFALTLAIGLPRLLLLLPNSFVILSKEGINNNIVGVGATVRYWPWAEISSCRVSTTTMEGKKYLTLRLIDREGHDLASFGMRDRALVDEIEGLLTRYGKRLEADSA